MTEAKAPRLAHRSAAGIDYRDASAVGALRKKYLVEHEHDFLLPIQGTQTSYLPV